ncbi:MAG: hypothetical protein WCJ30_22985 [Deltaproteobacteria bacterium]
MAVAGAVRVGSVYLAYRGAETGGASILAGARAAATAAAFTDFAAVVIAAGWLGIRRERLVSPTLLVALAIAAVLTRVALGSESGDGGAAAALVRTAADRLLTKPDPAFPHAIRVFVGFFAPVVALVGLGKRGAVPAITGCLALVLVVRSSPERPLQGLLLVVAALGLALTAADGPQLWSSLPPPPPDGSLDREPGR